MAQGNFVPNNPFIVLLKGLYQLVPLGQGPGNNLGLSRTVVDLNDGTYARTQIFPVWTGLPGSQNQDKAIGAFYVSLATFDTADIGPVQANGFC